MTRLSVVVALWVVFAFITWNVLYDRHVMREAVEFTRDQVVRHQHGAPLTSIHDGFSPRVREAAVRASWQVAPLAAAGIAAIVFAFRRVR